MSEELARKAVAKILDEGLAESTWRDNHPEAYSELLAYREDMIASVETVLRRRARLAVTEQET